MLIGMARGISEGVSKKNHVVFLFGDVLGLCEVKPFMLERIYF